MFKIGYIDGVQIIELKKFTDERGFLIETFRRDVLKDGLQPAECPLPAMSYVSYTKPGISRGPHEHIYQTDVFSFIGPGNFELWLWDNRSKSPTFGNKMIIPAGEDNLKTVVVPAGVVHGYKNISKVPAMVINYPDKLYKGDGKREEVDEIRHEGGMSAAGGKSTANNADKFYLDFINPVRNNVLKKQ